VIKVSTEGCTIILDTVVPGITVDDVFLLKDSNKVSATTTEVITRDGGRTYFIKADDWTTKKDLIQGEKYEIYVYSDTHEFKEPVEIIVS